MPRAHFRPRTSVVVVAVGLTNQVTGRSVTVNMLLDTGATYTAISMRVAKGLGVPVNLDQTTRILTAQGSFEKMPLIRLDRVQVLGMSSEGVEAVIINLPAETGLDGLLGGSYLRDYQVLIDYPQGTLEIE
ncbi:MAG: retropepsin-like aspartic protease [Chloroflexota bacterium]|nr:retropepsin-like aspartic protease [Chloroflexota bacterium]